MSTLVTFPHPTLQAALVKLLRGIGRLDTETLRYEYGPSVDTVQPLVVAVAAAEEERAELLAALERIAFEPIGHPEASHAQVLADVVEIARAAVAGALHG